VVVVVVDGQISLVEAKNKRNWHETPKGLCSDVLLSRKCLEKPMTRLLFLELGA
jgi:hypothetical protein